MARKSKLLNPIDTKIWKAALYTRLSREDGDKEESDSISNQKNILLDYIEEEHDIEFADFYIDDGFSGTNFDRPAFNEMLDHIKSGKINCVVVKDLSRLGRNYVEVGKYIETVFPMLNVRFIAITDGLDSIKNPSSMNNLIVPFKNIINDEYCRDISNKIRSSLTMKRKQGKFIGSFAPYGYKKDPADHNKLLIDEEPAEIVRNIYSMFLDGCSILQITREFNSNLIPSPSSLKNSKKSLWCARTVRRILTSEVYIGNLVQGTTKTKSYKLQKSETLPKSDWIICPNTHEAIIDREIFENVQNLLSRDNRTAPGTDKIYLFSGFLKCGDCGRAMNKKTIKQPYGTYDYYVCSTYKNLGKDFCTKHTIKSENLLSAVTETIRQQILLAVDLQKALNEASSRQNPTVSHKIEALISKKLSEKAKFEQLITGLYSDWKLGEITKDEYLLMKSDFSAKLEGVKKSLTLLEEKLQKSHTPEDLQRFLDYKDFTVLTRELLSALVEDIYIYEGGEIKIIFKYSDIFSGI